MAFLAITRKGQKAPPQESSVDLSQIPSDTLWISKAASNAIIEKSKEEPKESPYFRISVVGGGCSGLSYQFTFEQDKRDTDRLFENEDVKVIVDPKSLRVIGGSLLDWFDAGMRKEFRIMNTKQTKSCSCGKSFAL